MLVCGSNVAVVVAMLYFDWNLGLFQPKVATFLQISGSYFSKSGSKFSLSGTYF